tara:strand:- start:44 stop:571 length:528 start_codon:yes stop_codon:yes gene_type:complete
MPSFWSDPNFEPKRAFRFLIEFSPNRQESLQFLAKSVDRPSFTVSSNPHAFFNHTFYYPGKVTWNTINLTLVDAVSPNASDVFMKYLTSIGYNNPTDLETAIDKTITKRTATSAMGNFKILEMGTDSEGNSKAKGEWSLNNAFITEVNFGSHAYDSEEMIDIQLTIQYDWANYKP